MALLLSEDLESISSLEIAAGPVQDLGGQLWQRFTLIVRSGEYRLVLGNVEPGSAASAAVEEACVLCRKPLDELANLMDVMQQLVDFDRDKLLFEPAEPCFELVMLRSGITGIKVSVWLDAGNAKTGIYRWDAAGVRFHTTQEHLSDFLRQLKAEFAW
jgi:hypothetical protein